MINVLIADDHPVVRKGLRQIVEADPEIFVVAEARDGNEATDFARRLSWEVAVVDYSMPGRGGVDLVKEIKRHQPGRAVLVLSMLPEEPHATQVIKAGGSGYLNKESAAEDLTRAIKKVARGGKYISASLAEKLADEFALGAERPVHERLSDREYRVMCLLASGRPLNEIGRELFLSPSTISTYRLRILKKLNLENNAQLVRYALEHRLLG